MVEITFVCADEEKVTVQGAEGDSLMELALENMVPGILAECGGACVCATCHVIIAPEWSDRLSPRSAQEEAILEGALSVTERSRLACQISLSEDLQGLTVHVPEEQL